MSEKPKTYKPDDRLTRREAAAALGISVSRLAQHRRAGDIEQEKNVMTRAVRFCYSEVLRLKDARAQLLDVEHGPS